MITESNVDTGKPDKAEHDAPAKMMDVLRNSNFVKLWTAQILSQTAQQIVNFALLLQVARITASSTAVSGIIICFTIPAILFAAIAGVFVERNSKKVMLILTNVLRGVMVLGYLFINPDWGVGAVLPIIYIITLLFSAVSQFFNPAEASMIPLMVKKKELISANSLFNLTLPATQLGGFVVLGPLLLNTVFHDNFTGLYIFIFVLCLAAAFSTYLLPQDRPEETVAERRKKGEKVSVSGVAGGAATIAKSGYKEAAEELAEGWRFIRHDPVIMSAIIYWSVAIAVFMMLGTIGPGFLQYLNIDQSKLFYVLLPGGVGLVTGVLLVGRIARKDNREFMINVSLLAAGVTSDGVCRDLSDPEMVLLERVPNRAGRDGHTDLPGRPDLLPGAVQQLYFGARPDRTARTLTPGDTRPRLFGFLHNIERDFTVARLLCWRNCRLDRSGTSGVCYRGGCPYHSRHRAS